MPRDQFYEDPVMGWLMLGLALCAVGVVVLTVWYAYLQGWL